MTSLWGIVQWRLRFCLKYKWKKNYIYWNKSLGWSGLEETTIARDVGFLDFRKFLTNSHHVLRSSPWHYGLDENFMGTVQNRTNVFTATVVFSSWLSKRKINKWSSIGVCWVFFCVFSNKLNDRWATVFSKFTDYTHMWRTTSTLDLD